MRVLFIHRSIGRNLPLADGHVYELLARQPKHIDLSDYDQNYDTLTDSRGNKQTERLYLSIRRYKTGVLRGGFTETR